MSLLHKKIQEWDDPAGLEAFQNAKFRYWAKINNCQCDLPLPDPDMYIDEIDYKTVVDAEVVADLNVEPQQPAPVESSFLFTNEPIRATRWANTEVPLPTSGLAVQHLSANSDALLMVNRSQPTGQDVAENNSSWDVKLESSSAWNSARWDRNDAYGSKWNTSDGSQDAYGKNSGWGNDGTHETSGPHQNNNNEAGREHGRRNFRGNQQRKSASNTCGATWQRKKSVS